MKMKKSKYQYEDFVMDPRTFGDLNNPYRMVKKAYVVVKTVRLSTIDYENFVCDMTVKRDWLEGVATSEPSPFILECVRVKERSGECLDVLVAPDAAGYVAWAAHTVSE